MMVVLSLKNGKKHHYKRPALNVFTLIARKDNRAEILLPELSKTAGTSS